MTRRRAVIFAVSAVLSLALTIGVMEAVRYYVNRIYMPRHHHQPKGHVTWLVK